MNVIFTNTFLRAFLERDFSLLPMIVYRPRNRAARGSRFESPRLLIKIPLDERARAMIAGTAAR